MLDLKEIISNIDKLDTYKRVDSKHPSDLYFGIDDISRWTLLLVCDVQPQQITSSKIIHVNSGKRNDERWTISFSLNDNEFEDIFLLFCGDIIESSRNIKAKNKGVKFITQRYEKWKEIFSNSARTLLTPEQIKGLLGEMVFLEKKLIPEYGSIKSVLSWTGPRALHQDFILDQTWYEIKTISSGKNEVKISSIEQLDCDTEGQLVIILADKTSLTNKNAINLNIIYEKIMAKLQDDDISTQFSNLLLKLGYYPRPEYENVDYTFEVKGVNHYLVTNSFPCIRRNSIPKNITKADYYISISSIDNYKMEGVT